MTSGVKVSDHVKDLFNEMKVVKNDADLGQRLRLVVLEIRDGSIEVEKEFRQKDLEDNEDVYKFFLSQLSDDECRYLLYDCHFETKESCKKEELVFVMWAPESAPVKQKLHYASSKDAIKKMLSGIKHELQVNDRDECFHRDLFAEKMGKGIVKLEGHCVAHHDH